MAVRFELCREINGIMESKPIDASRFRFSEDSPDKGVLDCKDDPDLAGRKNRSQRKVIFSRRGETELQLGNNIVAKGRRI